ncbi:hypothetical protein TIFTF001_020575 [Ficus carica]|uniref:Uncharacterized protein n=1 Tax=Ficus carica TaxID=3494 RepID=A0AA88DB78_FICCA|nr:hypothetical protein TIFTF001_020575 [Ficus carica]
MSMVRHSRGSCRSQTTMSTLSERPSGSLRRGDLDEDGAAAVGMARFDS